MTRIADIKIALLAALIVLTTVICIPDKNKVVEVEPVLMRVPLIETEVLAG